MADIDAVMSWLEGLSQPDWRDFHSDSEVQSIAEDALELLKEQEVEIRQSRLALEHEAEITREAIGLCESCRKAIERAKERMEGR